jgi:Tfp pilus assembly protein PilO
MKEIFSRLNESEKKQLHLLSLVLLVVLLFFFFVSQGERRGYLNLSSDLRAEERVYEDAHKQRTAADLEWARWGQAYRDMDTLKETYFYKEKEIVNELRVDLEKILAEAGITARSFQYNYVNLEREQVKKVNVTFNFVGSYLILKRFLDTVERFPKFLVLEKIDFVKISGGGSLIELRINLAGYYEND